MGEVEPYDRYNDKYYANRDAIDQGQVYVNHVQAMTNEGLHDKSDIAAELAHRDIQIRELKTLLEQTRKTNFRLLQEAIKTNIQLRKLLHED